ncbi:hypothetical protein ACFL5Q_01445 [Planctomycetota bacterium]
MRKTGGFSFLELQVAFVLLGIALAGLIPLVVMQAKHLKRLEARLDHQTTHYLAPSTDEWARKLGVAASIELEDPGPLPEPPVTLIDDGDPDYSELGVNWQSSSTYGFNSDLRWNTGGDGSRTAVWEFAGIPAGNYEVLVTWAEYYALASNTPYTVYDGAIDEGTFRINQKVAPSGATFQGVPWESLGVFSIVDDPLWVELNDAANGWVCADAVRIVAVRNTVEVLSLEKSLGSEEVTARVSVASP